MAYSGAALAEAFASQVFTDLGETYSAQVMQTNNYNMTGGFMDPTAIPRCRGQGTCFNLQEGDGWCDIDSDCQPGLKCGIANCMDFQSKGDSQYYQEGGWADGQNCCYDELMFAAESSNEGELMIYIFIGGGLLALCLILGMVYLIRRSLKSSQLVVELNKEKAELEDWHTEGYEDLADEEETTRFKMYS